jgi:hypothetical protein
MFLSVAANVALLAIGIAFSVWFLQYRAVERQQMAKKMFADRYGMCVLCAAPPFAHSSWMLAMAIASRQPNRVSELEQFVAEGDWERASTIQEFEGDEDEVEFVVIKCPASDQMALKKILSTSELWSNDQLLEDILLSAPDRRRLNTLAGSNWTVLDRGHK